jgi:S-adenosylmethionine-diacylglycerol 3-amino-3-carboxypropyl transferase
MDERMSKNFFSELNYTLGNEDSTVEFEICKKLNPAKIFTICGSGGRSLPLVYDKTKLITLCDLSKEQLDLASLRFATYKELEESDFLKFWGYFPFHADDNLEFRKKIFYSLALESKAKKYFEKIFLEIEFRSLLYIGKWERTFQILAQINRTILGKNFDKILKYDNVSDQISYYQSAFPLLKWKMVLFLLGNKSFFNALLYKGEFIEKNSTRSHFEYYFDAFERLFTNDLAKNSFFVHLCFYGKINSLEGVPVEAMSNSIQRVKKYSNEIEYVNVDFVSFLTSGDKKYNFLSLSDVPSYFNGDLERDFMQKIRPSLVKDAVIVVRYYLRKSAVDLTSFEDITEEYSDLIKKEKVQMYEICVYKYRAS